MSVRINEVNDHIRSLGSYISEGWHIQIGDAKFVFTSQEQISKRTATSTISGEMIIAGLNFKSCAHFSNDSEGFLLEGNTVSPHPINLAPFATSLFKEIGFTLPNQIPNIKLNSLCLSYNTNTKDLYLSGKIIEKMAIPFLSDQSSEREIDLFFDIDIIYNKAKDSYTYNWNITGNIELAKATFSLACSVEEKNRNYTVSWQADNAVKSISITDFLKAIAITSDISLPSALDINLSKIVFEYHAANDELLLSAETSDTSTAFLSAKKQSNKWEFVFGAQLQSNGKFSDIPEIGHRFKMADFITLRETGIILASSAHKDFKMPTLPNLSDASAPQFSNELKLPVTKGLSAYAIMDFKENHDVKLQALSRILADDTLVLTAGYDNSSSGFILSALLDGSISLPAGKQSNFKMTNCGVELIFNEEISFEAFGTMTLKVDDDLLIVTPRIMLNETELEGSCTVDTRQLNLCHKLGLKGLHLDSAGIELGCVFEPPGMNIGIQGKAHIGENAAGTDDFTFVLEVVPGPIPIPDPLYLSFYIDELSLDELACIYTGKEGNSGLDKVNFIGFSKLSFYWSEEVVLLPDGTASQPGIGFSGNVQIANFAAHADMKIDADTGLKGDAQIAPIHLPHILSITGNGKGLPPADTNPTTVDASKLKAMNSSPAYTKVPKNIKIPSGGPVFHLDTTDGLLLDASINIKLFDLASETLQATVNERCMKFKLDCDVASLSELSLHGRLYDATKFSSFGDFRCGIKTSFSIKKVPIKIDTYFDGCIAIDIQPHIGDVHVSISGKFGFEGVHYTISSFDIDPNNFSFENIPAIVVSKIESMAESLFANYIEDQLKEIAQKLIHKGKKKVKHWAHKIGL